MALRAAMPCLRHGALFARTIPVMRQRAALAPFRWRPRYASSQAATAERDSMEDTVSEQRQVLFPNAKKLEEAYQQQDLQRGVAVPPEQWSPRRVPYKTYEKDAAPDDSDEEEEEGIALAKEAEVEGLEVGMEEVGFRYNGPEPTTFGDWAHKGHRLLMELVVARGSNDWRTGMGRSATVNLTESAAFAFAAARHDQEFVWCRTLEDAGKDEAGCSRCNQVKDDNERSRTNSAPKQQRLNNSNNQEFGIACLCKAFVVMLLSHKFLVQGPDFLIQKRIQKDNQFAVAADYASKMAAISQVTHWFEGKQKFDFAETEKRSSEFIKQEMNSCSEELKIRRRTRLRNLYEAEALVAVKDGRAIQKAQAVAAPRASARGRGNGGARSGAPWVGLSGLCGAVAVGRQRRRLRALPFGISVVGTGSAAPETVVSNDDLAEIVETSDEWISQRTGIRRRHVLAPDESLASLSAKAASRALEAAKMSPEDVDLVIHATSTPDDLFGTGPQVASMLGADNAVAFDLTAACSGFVFALTTAAQYVRSGSFKSAVVIGADCLSRWVDWSDRNTCVLFGDGAGAMVITATDAEKDALLGFRMGSDGNGACHLGLNAEADGVSLGAGKEGGDGRYRKVTMNGKEVFRFATSRAPETLSKLMEQHNISGEEVDWLLLHQANRRIMDSAARRLKLPKEKILCNLDEYGNTSAASIPLALDEAVKEGKVQPGQLVACCGFGAGLTWGGMLLRM
ncbi:fabH [Symbiodinium sp. CCMP2592]|nr:fabH [Symbiodinium sp. CCMP2592]